MCTLVCMASESTTAAADVRETWERVRCVRDGLVASQVERPRKKRSPKEGLLVTDSVDTS